MSPRTRWILIGAVLTLVVALGGLTWYYATLPERLSQHETIVYGQNSLVPGSQAALRVVVRDTRDATPLPGAEIAISLKPVGGGPAVALYTGTTSPEGAADVSFAVPETSGEHTLVIETRSSIGSDSFQQNITIERDYRVLLTTDKPLYQPGQVIHLRALALGTFDLKPAAGQAIEFIIADGKGNKVFRQSAELSEYGVASADFQLATEVNTGPYKISAVLGDTTSEKTVTVERYVLPKFKASLQTDRTFYQPGQRVTGSLDANYFFGKPVAGGRVELTGYTFDFEQTITFELEGKTNEQGHFEFTFDLPAFIAGSDLDGGLGRFYLQARVTDLAEHTEISNLSLPVAGSLLVIEAVPESGQFLPGLENILYVLVSYPDGSPADAEINVQVYETGEMLSAKTGVYGLAEVRLTPNSPYQSLGIHATDATGASARKEFNFEGAWADEPVLLRPDRPVYRVGETMQLNVFTSGETGTIFLDIIREGQTISTRSLAVSEGKAQAAVDLTPDMFGTLEIHAYKILSWGGITRSTRLVVVDQADSLNIAMNPAKDSFLPGEAGSVAMQISGQDGAGVQAALGLAIVDESVFALAEQDPGFARLYFMLEQELLQPKYDLHGFSIPDLLEGLPVSAEPTARAVEGAAMASLAAAVPTGNVFSLSANSHEQAARRAVDRQDAFFEGFSAVLFGLFLLVPLAAFGVSLYGAHQAGGAWRSLGVAFSIVAIFVLVLTAWPHPWASSPMDKLGVLMDWLTYQGDGALITLGLAGLVSFIGLAVYAWRKPAHDLPGHAALGWVFGLILLALPVLFLLLVAISNADLYPDDGYIITGLVAFALLPFSFLVWAGSLGFQKRWLPALASGLVTFFLPLMLIPLAMVATSASLVVGAPMPGGVVMEAAGMDRQFLDLMPQVVETVVVAELEAVVKESEAPGGSASQPPRLRQYFPETMLWLPDALTAPDGSYTLDFDAADSITTWRLTALASSQDGRLGSATGSIRVFQDFFVDLDLPLALTVGDEISVPVGVFNYLPEAQSVRLVLEQPGWFELLDDAEKTIEVAPNEITVVYFRVRALQFGRQPFQVTAWGSRMSDAIRKDVQVYPDGKPIRFTASDRLAPDSPASQSFSIPPEAIAGTQTLLVKIYPGILSQVVEGLDSILRMPYGCFEQTSSTTYPNVLVLDYLQSTNQASPEVQFTAQEYINLGYQRLTTFEVSGGGFSLFGDAPADRMLTAYGLQEFTDMSRVHNVDPALINRAAQWIFSEQNSDGTWENDQGLVHETTWSSLADDRLPVTAYIAWSLADAGFVAELERTNALPYLRENQANATDPYVLALLANALVASDLAAGREIAPVTLGVLERLSQQAIFEDGVATWPSGVATFVGSEGRTGSIETTALAALAFLRSNTYPDLANQALTALVRNKDSFGTWHSTQATVLALKALIQTIRAGAENVDASITITLDGGQEKTIQVNRQNFDVVQMITFDDVPVGRPAVIEISAVGEGNLMYQVSGSYYLPWESVSLYPELIEINDLVSIDVRYDRTELAVDETVRVDVTVSLNQPGGRAEWALIDLGLPPGFTVETGDLQALVARYDDTPKDYPFPTIQRYELTGRQLLVYIGNLSEGNPLSFSYHLRAKFPLRAQTPASSAYDYYNPDTSGEQAPQTLTVVAP